MDTANIQLEKRPPLAIVTIDRLKVLNALNAATLTELFSTPVQLTERDGFFHAW